MTAQELQPLPNLCVCVCVCVCVWRWGKRACNSVHMCKELRYSQVIAKYHVWIDLHQQV